MSGSHKGPQKPMSKFTNDTTSPTRAPASSHDTTVLVPEKTKPNQKTYLKKTGMPRHLIDQEMLLLNLLQLFHPIQTKARMLSDNQEEALLIEKLPADYGSLFSYLYPTRDPTTNTYPVNQEHSDAFKAVVGKGQSGLGELLPLMFLFNEVDTKLDNFFYNPKTQKITRIDMDYGFGDRRRPNFEFKITPEDLTHILTPPNYKAYNWLDYTCAAQIIASNNLPLRDTDLYTPEFCREINRGILQVLLLPEAIIRVFVEQYISHPLEKEAKFNSLLNYQRKIRNAAMKEPHFQKYLQNKNKEAEIDKQNLIEKFNQYKINKDNPLSDHVKIEDFVNAQMNTLETEMRFHIASLNGQQAPKNQNELLANHQGHTPTHFAATMDSLVWLTPSNLHKKTTFNTPDENGKNAAHIAAERGKTSSIAAFSLYTTVSINAVDKEGNTPVLLAAKASEYDSVLNLVTNKAQLLPKNHQGLNVLHYAVLNQDEKMMLFLLQKNETLLGIQDNNGQTPLHYVAQLEKKEKPLSLFHNEKHPVTILDIQDHQGKTALHYSVIHNNLNCAHNLFEQGANVNLADTAQKTALHYAAETNNLAVLQYLLTHRDRLNLEITKDSTGKTAFDYATPEAQAIFRTTLTQDEFAQKIGTDSTQKLTPTSQPLTFAAHHSPSASPSNAPGAPSSSPAAPPPYASPKP